MIRIISARENSLEKCMEIVLGMVVRKESIPFSIHSQWNLSNKSPSVVLPNCSIWISLAHGKEKVRNYHMQKYESFPRKSKCCGPKIRFLILPSQITSALVKDASMKRNSNR